MGDYIPRRIDEAETFSATQSYMPDGMYLHWHTFYEFDFIVSGTAVHLLNGVEQKVEPGDVILLSPTDFHEYKSINGSPLTIINLHFKDSRLPDEICRILWTSSGTITHFDLESDHLISRLFYSILDESKKKEAFSDQMVNSLLAAIIVEIARTGKTTEENISSLADNRMVSALVYIEQHFREPIKLSDIAEHTAFSASYFSKIFHDEFGETFQSYLVRRRLEWAYTLIKTTASPISNICTESGFSCLTYFERAFKSKYNISPRSCRRMYSD